MSEKKYKATTEETASSDVVKRAEPLSIRLQLLVTVNVILGGVIAVLLVIDYRREMTDAVVNKHVSLEDEAIAIHRAVQHLYLGHGTGDVQNYIDHVCLKMRDERSPGHNIAVRIDGKVFQSSQHKDGSRGIIKAMQFAHRAHDHRASFGTETLIVGSFGENGVFVFVSEYMTNIRRSIRQKVILRLLSLAMLALAAAAIVNFVLLKLVVKPINELVATVDHVAGGMLGIQVGKFRSRELQQLADAINSMSSKLAESDRHRLQQMKKAREIQEHLLPGDVELPGVLMSRLFCPAEDVGGDYYDFIELSDGSWLICIADVTGHGVPAAMEAAILKTLLLQAVEHYSSPSDVLAFINRRFVATSLPEYFASMFLGRWHPSSALFEYASAGHEPGFFMDAYQQRIRELSATGLFVGIDSSTDWSTESLTVTAGSRLLLVTDGATQICNHDNQMFGIAQFRQLFSDANHESLDEMVDHIHKSLKAYRDSNIADDDLTMLLLDFHPTHNPQLKSISKRF